ncbi:MAG TPA: SPRY domain-containing protein [Steroidobacteraceae bacterium]
MLGTAKNQSFRARVAARGPNGHIMIGMAPARINRDSSNYNKYAFCIYVNDGGLYSGSGTKAQLSTAAIPEGAVVSVQLDRAQRTISFAVNGGPTVGSISQLPDEDLYPFAEFREQGGAVELLPL